MRIYLTRILFSISFFLFLFLNISIAFSMSPSEDMNPSSPEKKFKRSIARKGPTPTKKVIETTEHSESIDKEEAKFDENREMFYFGNSLDSPYDRHEVYIKEFLRNEDEEYELEEGLQKLLEAKDSTNTMMKDINEIKKWEALLKDKDRRYQIDTANEHPHYYHGQLIMDFGNNSRYIGSGTLIDKRVVLTAAHNLYDRKTKKKAEKVTFYAGKTGPTSSIAIGFSESIDYPEEWTLDSNHHEHDIGVVILSKEFEELYDSKGLAYIGISPLSDEELPSKKFFISGYPGAVFLKDYGLKLTNGHFMFEHFGEHLPSTTNKLVHYNIDTSPGQSGSAVWYKDNDGNYVCFAVHVRGGKKGQKYNIGTRINNENYNRILSWVEPKIKPVEEHK